MSHLCYLYVVYMMAVLSQIPRWPCGIGLFSREWSSIAAIAAHYLHQCPSYIYAA